MRALFDNSIFKMQKNGGISRYWFEILNRLSKDNNIKFSELRHLGCAGPLDTRNSKEIGKMEYLFSGLRNSKLSSFCHTPYLFLPFGNNIFRIITIHDMLPFTHAINPARDRVRSSLIASSLKKSDIIVSVSDATKKEALRIFPSIAEEKIKVIYHGISDAFSTFQGPKVRSDSKPYLIFVGKRDGYKNFLPFIEAFNQSSFKNDFELLVIGGGKFNDVEKSAISNLSLENTIKKYEAISDEMLVELYHNAQALIYPSEAEGFGFPILEAMAAKCPVICFNKSSMGEISNNHAIQLEELTKYGFEDAVRQIDKFRSEKYLSTAEIHSKKFTWNESYRLHKELYHSIE